MTDWPAAPDTATLSHQPCCPSPHRLVPTLQVTGKVLYNGHSFDEFIPERSAAYISQVGVAHGHITGSACVWAVAALDAMPP